MPRADPEELPRQRLLGGYKPSSTSLVGRVAASTAIAAGATGLVAALVSVSIVSRLELAADDRRLRGAVATALLELRPTLGRAGAAPGSPKTALEEGVEEEEAELAPESIRILVHESDRYTGGDRQLPRLAPGTCESRPLAGSTLRACAGHEAPLHVVAAAVRTPHDKTELLLGCLAAAAVAAAAAAIASRRAARWALGPLTRLRDSLQTVDALGPQTTSIAGDDACREVATLRAALADLVVRLAQSLDSARRFSADAAHELKTPLAVMRVELDLLAEEGLDLPARRTVENLRARVLALGTLVERLLALATASEGGRLAEAAVSLEDVVTEVVGRLGGAARSRVRLRLEAPGIVLGDEALLATLVENAVDNALKFSGNKPVEVQVAEIDDVVVLEVTDDGPGVPPADRTRAFEAFFRSPGTRASDLPGHGVGLALVAQIARVHDGRAELVDPVERCTGARLRVTLPRWSPRAPRPAAAREQDATAARASTR